MAGSFVQGLPTAEADDAKTIVAEALAPREAAFAVTAESDAVGIEAARVIKPGSIKERWPVKTYQDADKDKVKQQIVDTTITELGAFARPAGWEDVQADPSLELRTTRDAPAETTIWRIKANVIGLRMESDRDYHLELKDDSGAEMIAEIPVPDVAYIGDGNPLAGDIQAARDAIDGRFKATVQTQSFARSDITGKLVPVQTIASRDRGVAVAEVAAPDLVALTASAGDAVGIETFSTSIPATPVTITGIGFFDKSHGQVGNAPNYIELHPVLKVEF